MKSTFKPETNGHSKQAEAHLKGKEARTTKIEWLASLGLPALPVAPAFPAEQYPTKDGKPKFTGKNPSYLDQAGTPRGVKHSNYQAKLPTRGVSEEWFAHPDNGIGTLGGWNNTFWIDLDAKKFTSPQECEDAAYATAAKIEEQTGVRPYIERTRSGGYHLGVRVKQTPSFTNFALERGGSHKGEALGKGRFCVLSPTPGYEVISQPEELPEIESLESIGLYPTRGAGKASKAKGGTEGKGKGKTQGKDSPILKKYKRFKPVGALPLDKLISQKNLDIYQGRWNEKDRSESLATLAQELYGWENWCEVNGQPLNQRPDDLILDTAQRMGMDSRKADACVQSINRSFCLPATYQEGNGDESCAMKVRLAVPRQQEEDDTKNEWECPESFKEELGFFYPCVDILGNAIQKFEPRCNFDFTIERELSSEDGGGVVLKMRRSLDFEYKRVILHSLDYGTARDFEKALKKAYGAGVVVNLNDYQAKSLLQSRLQDYRDCGGKVFRLVDRHGQQEDGTWVFKDRQFKADGTPTNEAESLWVWNSALGKEDFIPCPELSEPNGIEGLKELFKAARIVFGGNINQFIFCVAWVVASLHQKAIADAEGVFPGFNAYGNSGGGKTLAMEASLSLVGSNWSRDGMVSSITQSALYEFLSKTGSLPIIWDDPPRDDEIDELSKRTYNRIKRLVRGNQQTPHSSLGFNTNHVIGANQAAAWNRLCRVEFPKGGNPLGIPQMKEAQKVASGSLPELLKIGYDPKAIAEIQAELLPRLSLAHARVPWNWSLLIWYAERVMELVGGEENPRQWALANLAPIENNAEKDGDALADFIRSLSALESTNQVGSWNKCLHRDRKGNEWVALHYDSVWREVDKTFKPTTYDKETIQAQILRAGGHTRKTARFDPSKDEVQTHRRLQMQNEIPDDLEKVVKKAWFIPVHLFEVPEEEEDPCNQPVTAVTSCNQSLVTNGNNGISRVSVPSPNPCNHVTNKKGLEEEERVTKDPPPTVESVTDKNLSHDEPTSENPVTSGYEESGIDETTQNPGVQPVTNSGYSSVTSGYKRLQRLQEEEEAPPQEGDLYWTLVEKTIVEGGEIITIDQHLVRVTAVTERGVYAKDADPREPRFEALFLTFDEIVRHRMLDWSEVDLRGD